MTWQDFLKAWLTDGPWSVGAIDPATNDHAWLTSEDMGQLETFVAEQQALGRNLYCQLNLCKGDLGTARASKSDVVLALCVATEVDPPEEISTPEALQDWQQRTAEKWSDPVYWEQQGLPTPSLLVFSGSGFQAAHLLAEPIQLVSVVNGSLVVDRAAIERVEEVNRGICQAVGGDTASTGVERLLRLPGTVNYPGPSKMKKGRTGAVPSELMYLDPQVTHDLSRFPRVERKVTAPSEIPMFEGLPPPEKLAEAAELLAADWPVKGRHNAFLALSGGLAHAGWPAEAVEALTVAVAQRMTDSDEKAIYDRSPMSRQTVDKVQSGMVVKSWGTLVVEHGIEPSILRRAQNLLGVATEPERDDGFFQKLVENHARPANAPATDLEYDARIRTEVNRRQSSRDPAVAVERELLRRIQQNKAPWDDGMDDDQCRSALLHAAVMLVQSAPENATIAQHERRLLSLSGRFAPELSEMVKAAIEHVNEKRRQTGASEFSRDTSGVPYAAGPPMQTNFDIAVARLGWAFKYNSFADRKLVRTSEQGEWEVLQDHHVNHLRWTIAGEHGFLLPEKEVYALTSHRAHQASYHPVVDWLDSLNDWDRIGRVGDANTPSWLTTYCGVKDTPYVRAVGRLLLCAAVRRVRDPGCKYDEMVILEGGQGVGKSTMWATLCPDREWFTDDFSLKYDTKQLMEVTKGKWIIEAPELKGKTDNDLGHLKALLSRAVEVARMAYGREAQERRRQFVIVGTTNEYEYLQDLTGDRRYWPVEVGEIDLEALRRDRDLLWAEASYLEAQNPEETYIRLDPSLYAAAAEEQALRRVDDPHVVALTPFLHGLTGALYIKDVWKLLGFHEEKLPSKREQGCMAAALKALGWRRRARRADGLTWYVRGATDDERAVELKVTGGAMQGYKVQAASSVTPGLQPESPPPRIVEDRSN